MSDEWCTQYHCAGDCGLPHDLKEANEFASAPMTCLGCNLLLMPERCVERGGVTVCDQCPT